MFLVGRNCWWRKFSRVKWIPNEQKSLYEKLCNYLALMVFKIESAQNVGILTADRKHQPLCRAPFSTSGCSLNGFFFPSLVFSETNQKWGQLIKYLLIRGSIKCLLNAFNLSLMSELIQFKITFTRRLFYYCETCDGWSVWIRLSTYSFDTKITEYFLIDASNMFPILHYVRQ